MKKIILTKGLPASGKTTWAKELIDKNPGMYKRVNKDDLRAMLDNSKWSHGNENFVLELRDTTIMMALSHGKHVIVDDTNFHPKHEERMKELAKLNGAEVEIVDTFCQTPLEECIKRDLKRPNSVGEKVITTMYNEYLKPKPVVREWDVTLPNAIICDLDGTLALFGNENPYDRDFMKDHLNEAVADILYKNNGETIIFSGRNDKYREVTKAWLKGHSVRYSALVMRKDGDFRKDHEIKKEMFSEHIEGKYNVLFVLDDRDQVVNVWRNELGLTVFQVAEGDF